MPANDAPLIHPTALVSPDARLGRGVQIGPYVVIEGAAEIGGRCVIQGHAVIGAHVRMGEDNLVGCGAILGGDPQDFAFRPEIQSEVRIGARNRIREYCTIHRGTAEGSATVVGDDCFLMTGGHLGHNARVGNRVILANNVLLGGHASVEDGAFVGGGTVVHQHIRVGRLAIASGGSAFSVHVPPFTTAALRNLVFGLNVIGLRRAGFSADQRRDVKAAFDLVYRQGLNTTQLLAAAAEREWGPEGQAFIDFVAATRKKGICALRKKKVEESAREPE